MSYIISYMVSIIICDLAVIYGIYDWSKGYNGLNTQITGKSNEYLHKLFWLIFIPGLNIFKSLQFVINPEKYLQHES